MIKTKQRFDMATQVLSGVLKEKRASIVRVAILVGIIAYTLSVAMR